MWQPVRERARESGWWEATRQTEVEAARQKDGSRCRSKEADIYTEDKTKR